MNPSHMLHKDFLWVPPFPTIIGAIVLGGVQAMVMVVTGAFCAAFVRGMAGSGARARIAA
jgi:hypothetical protein